LHLEIKRLKKNIQIALTGNPNCGKTSLFNALTGMRQKVANYPGVTVDKKTGEFTLNESTKVTIVDLPGTYSLYPKSLDEFVAFDVLLNKDNESYPDIIIVVADASNLKRNLLFCSQIIDLKIPVVIALNMLDVARHSHILLDIPALTKGLGVPVVPINARKGEGVEALKKCLLNPMLPNKSYLIDLTKLQPLLTQEIKPIIESESDYAALLTAHHYMNIFCLDAKTK
jgi:ferrous iron transport protein B